MWNSRRHLTAHSHIYHTCVRIQFIYDARISGQPDWFKCCVSVINRLTSPWGHLWIILHVSDEMLLSSVCKPHFISFHLDCKDKNVNAIYVAGLRMNRIWFWHKINYYLACHAHNRTQLYVHVVVIVVVVAVVLHICEYE